MRVPIRKGGKYTYLKPDPNLTPEKFLVLQKNLEKLIKIIRPQAAKDVKRLGENGDFSENAEYQIAKGRLRGINQRIIDLQDQLKNVQIIKPNKNAQTIQLGHTVSVAINGQIKTFQILGSAETDPAKHIISHNSPLGQALMGHKAGDEITINLRGKKAEYKIMKIK